MGKPTDAPTKAGISFAQVVMGNNGEPATAAAPLTSAQIRSLAQQGDLPALLKLLDQNATALERKMTLADACADALDAFFQSDANEALKPKLHRGALIEQIRAAEKAVEPLALEGEDVGVIKERVGKHYMSAQFVLRVCRLIDPATKG